MDVGSFLITHAQSPKLIEPSERPLDDPTPSAQSASMFGVALREPRHNPAGTLTAPDCLRVIATVAQHTIRTMARSPSLALQGWNGINQCEGLLRIVTIRARELDGERNTTTVTNQMTLAAKLGPIGGIGTCLLPPKTARTELPSTIARDQSILSQRASQSKSTKWINCQSPASCQSRKRRQQVMPEPHPNS